MLCSGYSTLCATANATLRNLDRYFAGNGVFTWLLSPFNLLMDLLALPYWNKASTS